MGPDKSRLSHTWYKNAINIDGANDPVSDVKLIRTDTTLDLSQKAEKVCFRMLRVRDSNSTPIGKLLYGILGFVKKKRK